MTDEILDERLAHWSSASNCAEEYERLKAYRDENPTRALVNYTSCQTRAWVGARVVMFAPDGPWGRVIAKNADGTAQVGVKIDEALAWLKRSTGGNVKMP